MPIPLTGAVGPQTAQDGAAPPVRQGRAGEVVVTDLHGRYYEQAYRKNLFIAYCAAQATSVAGTAMVGLQVWNGSPIANGVNLALLKTSGMIVVTSASLTSVVLAVGTGQVSAPTSQTAATKVSNCFIGGVGPQATAISAGTFTNAPVAIKNLMHNTAAIASTGEDQGWSIDLEGAIIIPPQCHVAIAAVGAAAAASGMNLDLMWEEIPA